MQASQYKSWFAVWLPLGLRRIDAYFMRSYVKTFFVILAAFMAVTAIGDLFQRFDDFILFSRRESQDMQSILLMLARYYSTFVPQLVFQYMLPVSMVLAGSITATASYSGPRGNNEYIVMRSVGVPVLRAFFPLVFPAFALALLFQAGRDSFLPDMVRESEAILTRLRNRVGKPTSVSVVGRDGVQTAAIGWYDPDGVAHNIIIEIRDTEKFHRGDAGLGDNDFVAYRAAAAKLMRGPDGEYSWVPLEKGEKHTYGSFVRERTPWVDPLPTGVTPAMIERQTYGDAVSSWRDLLLMREDNAGARFEMHWRLADPLACAILVMLGTGFCMARMLRGSSTSFIQSVAVSMVVAGVFYLMRLGGKSLWEAGTLTAAAGVWYPLAAGALLSLPVAWWMEP